MHRCGAREVVGKGGAEVGENGLAAMAEFAVCGFARAAKSKRRIDARVCA